jgi:hypothetical protein
MMATALVAEEIERLDNKTDEEIMTIYANQMLGRFPSTVVLDALGHIMDQRKLTPHELKLSLKYINFNGEIKTVHFASI